MFLNTELGVVQNQGRLHILRGEYNGFPTINHIPGDDFLVHTHPVFESLPGHFRKFDVQNATSRIEAVIDWGGNITHFNNTGIIANPAMSPINKLGRIVGYR